MRSFNIYACLLVLIGALLSFSSVSAKEYSIPEIQIEVQVNTDGTVTVTEHRTYVFDGSYTWANYRLPKSGYSAIREITVSENGEPFINLNTEEPGSFLIEESNKAYNIKWFYRAEDETRTFSVSYILEEAIVIGPDWSEFFWTYAASDREKSTETIGILLQLPESVPPSDLHHWVREPAWAINATTFENGLEFKGSDISRRQAVIIRTVFPTSVFDETIIQISDSSFSLDQAENDEATYREEKRLAAEEEQQQKSMAIEYSIILSGLSLIAFIFFYRKYGLRHKVRLSVSESIMLPGREKPAAVGWLLLNRTITSGHMIATLLDLARMGYFELKENKADEVGFFKSKDNYFTVHPKSTEVRTDDLEAYETGLLEFVNERIRVKGNKFEDIFDFQKTEVSKWFQSWKKELKTHCDSKEWIDKDSYKGMYWNFGVQFALDALAFIGIFLIHPIMALSLIITSILMVLSLIIIRRTPKGEETYRRWKAYRNALKNAKEHSIRDEHLGKHFIYSIALGISKQHIEPIFEQHPGAATTLYWIVILPGSGSSPADIAGSFSNLAATATTSASGGSFSGGASAGSAGGGASGGAG
jgi:uncharacterized membrane protein